jgi:hypothetical protein
MKGNKRWRENAKKARQVAEKLFPKEIWMRVAGGIFLSPHRPVGKNSNYQDEMRDAKILRSFGSVVYLTPEDRTAPGKKFDAIVDGEEMEFKNIYGNANTLQGQFLKSRKQAMNVFINLEESSLNKQDAIKALYGVRNSPKYDKDNKFNGGAIVLKIKGERKLIHLAVDDLKAKTT